MMTTEARPETTTGAAEFAAATAATRQLAVAYTGALVDMLDASESRRETMLTGNREQRRGLVRDMIAELTA